MGKAKNLKKRVKSYTKIKQLNPRIRQLVSVAQQLKFKTLASELEAILIEAELIRIHQPSFNIRLKDDKSPIYIHITAETFPRVLKKRKQEIYKSKIKGTILGPFSSAYKLNEVLVIARKIFPWCDEKGKRKIFHHTMKYSKTKINKACFYYHLNLCPGACVGQIAAVNYQKQIKQLIKFLRGEKQDLLKNLNLQMKKSAEQLLYEQAAIYRNQIQLIKEVTSRQYKLKANAILPTFYQDQTQDALLHLKKIVATFISLPADYQFQRIEGYDVSNIQGKNAAVSMVVFKDGQAEKKEYRLFNIRSLDTPNDYQMLKEALTRRQNQTWPIPNLVIIDGGKGQLKAALSVWHWSNPVISIAKNPDRIIIAQPEANNTKKLNYQVIKLIAQHPTLHLVQQVRDESHRFAKKQHHRLSMRQFIDTKG